MKRLLVIDDTPGKAMRVKVAAEKANFEVVIMEVLETAKNFLRENTVDAIVVDGQFFLEEGENMPSLHGAGEELMQWLEKERMKIPVLGFSNVSFQTTYSYFWGQMGKLFERDTFYEFISSLEDQSN